MPNWYTSREKVKAALDASTAINDTLIDQHIEAASRMVDARLGRRFIPKTETRYYRWSQFNGKGGVLYLDEDLLSVSTNGITSQNGSVTLAATDYLLEPINQPPYRRIEIDASSTASTAEFAAGDTPQRAIAVTGSWGYDNDTVTAGTVASGLASDATATSMVCSNGSLVDVGDTLLIESEQVFVSERTFAALGSILVNDASITLAINDQTITVDGSHGILAGEVIKLDSEEMKVLSVSGNNLSVIRAWNGTTLAAHADDTAVQINRTLTIQRGVNGTTAATHANSTAASRYRVPGDIEALCRAQAVHNYMQDQSGQTGVVGGAESAVNVRPVAVKGLWTAVERAYMRPLAGVL